MKTEILVYKNCGRKNATHNLRWVKKQEYLTKQEFIWQTVFQPCLYQSDYNERTLCKAPWMEITTEIRWRRDLHPHTEAELSF